MSNFRVFKSSSRILKGRKKIVREFTVWQGFEIVAAIVALMIFIYLLWGLGIINFDVL